MYKKYLKVMPSRTGNGVFTTIDIPAKLPIIEVTGNLYNKNSLPDHPANLQVSSNLFIGPSGDIDDYVNHSCNPNCYLHIVGSRALIYSIYFISKGTEITFDYSTSSTDTLETWNMKCNCGYINCRKIISGLKYLDKDLIELYKKKNIIPLFMKEKVFI